MERNRRLFKRLFSPDLFAVFIDVGHYTMDIEAYSSVVDKLNSLPVSSTLKEDLCFNAGHMEVFS